MALRAKMSNVTSSVRTSLVRWWRSWLRPGAAGDKNAVSPGAVSPGAVSPGAVSPGRRPTAPTASTDHERPSRPLAYPCWSARAASIGDPLVTLRRVLEGDGPMSPFGQKLMTLAVAGDPSFPVFPSAALELDLALRRPNVSYEALTAIVRTDPSLTERVIRAASSAAAGSTVADLGAALARLGTDGVWRVAMTAVLEAPVFRSRGWSVEAELARKVAVTTGEKLSESSADPRVDQGLAFLAGTLHEVGTLQILRHAPMDLPPQALGRLVADAGPALGQHLVAGWNLDPRVAPLIGALAAADDGDLTRRAVRAAQVAAHTAVFGEGDEPSPPAEGPSTLN